MLLTPDELFEPRTPEHGEFRALAVNVTPAGYPLLLMHLYKRLDDAGRRTLLDTTREAVEGRLW